MGPAFFSKKFKRATGPTDMKINTLVVVDNNIPWHARSVLSSKFRPTLGTSLEERAGIGESGGSVHGDPAKMGEPNLIVEFGSLTQAMSVHCRCGSIPGMKSGQVYIKHAHAGSPSECYMKCRLPPTA